MTTLPRPKTRLFVDRRQVALRVGYRFFGIRTRAMRELWSERNRLDWSVVYLPFGLRAFYRKDGP